MTEWLSDREPFDAELSRRQVESLLDALPATARVLDIGCGGGRVLVPLAAAGHVVTGVERDAELAAESRGAASGRAVIIEEPFPGPRATAAGPFDAVLLLGNVLMTYPDVDDAVRLLAAARSVLVPGGALYVDDIPGEFWPEVTEGYWLGGCSEDGAMQLVWARDDAVFTIRRGNAVDASEGELTANDVRYRLWTAGSLRLIARLGGLSVPEPRPRGGLLVMRRLAEAGSGGSKGPG